MAAFSDQQGIRKPGEASSRPGVHPPEALPLGRLLVERGLLGEEQLAAGLTEQERVGAPLGKVLIELGFVDAAAVAQALATQHGGLLKTEYGFATGFGTRRPGAALLEPPLSPAPPAGMPISSDPDPASPGLVALPGGSSPSTELPSQPPFLESPLAAVSAEPPDGEQAVGSAQVEPQAERQDRVETVPAEPDATMPAWPSSAEDVAESASWIGAVEGRRETILRDLETVAADGDLAPFAELPEAHQRVESAGFDYARERLAEVDPARDGLRATPAAWGRGADEGEALSGRLPAAQEQPETILPDPETLAVERDLAPGESTATTADADEARVGLDGAAARIADLEVELASAQEVTSAHADHQLRLRITVLEGELEATRLALETATAEYGAARDAAETAAVRIEQLEQQLASARASDRALRTENDLLRAAAFEQSATGRHLQDRLVDQRLIDIEQRLETVSAQIAALQGRSVSN